MLAALAAGLFCLAGFRAGAQILFDNTKAETAGNADWIIDTHQPVPSPSMTGITAGASENYWTGALSSWGVALAKLRNTGQISLAGNGLETLPSSGRITYGDGSNARDLSHYKVYVVCEPNILFTANEKTAILNFVQNGGGLFLVADHNGSDRNNDGADSLHVWNDLFSNNSVQTTPFGFTFNADNVTPSSPIVDSAATNPVINGLGGDVTTIKYDLGCTMTISDPSVCHAAVWQANPAQVMVLYGTFGAGRFVAIGDSSVVEDATSSQGTTYAGWTTPVDNGYAAINGTVWLLKTNSIVLSAPSVTTAGVSGVSSNSATLNATVNPNNQATTAQFLHGLTTNYNLSAAVTGTLTGGSAQAVSAAITGLAPSTLYHFAITATNNSGSVTGLDQSFTTAAISSGGSGTNYTGVLAGWDVNGLSGYGSSPQAPTTNAPNVLVTGLTRGRGLTTSGTAAGRAWGANGWSQSTAAAGISATQFMTFALTVTNGGTLTISNISRFDYRHSSSGPSNGVLSVQIGGGAFTDLTNFYYASSASAGASLGVIDLSGVSALQNIPAGTTVTFRLVNYNASGTGGTWYVYDVANSTALDFSLSGSVNYPTSAATLPPIQLWRQQWFGFTNNSGPAADTFVASSDGMPNLLKYALGLNPLVPASNPITGDIATGFLRLTVPRNTNATDITFLIESTGSVAGTWNTNATVIDLNTPPLLRGHDTNAVPAASQRYIRLHVTDP